MNLFLPNCFFRHDQKMTCILCQIFNFQDCPFCRAKPADFVMDPEKVPIAKFMIKNKRFLDYGVSSLHFGLRATEWLFKVGFNSDFEEW